MRRSSLRVAALAAMLAAPALHAQATPKQGTFGAEVTTSSLDFVTPSASLLWMATPNVALVTSFSATTRNDFTTIVAGIGVRRYVPRPAKLRPIVGGGLTFGNSSFDSPIGGDESFSQVGIYGEAGAGWFFSPNLMLGATGIVSLSGGDGQSSVNARLVRLHAAVFF